MIIAFTGFGIFWLEPLSYLQAKELLSPLWRMFLLPVGVLSLDLIVFDTSIACFTQNTWFFLSGPGFFLWDGARWLPSLKPFLETFSFKDFHCYFLDFSWRSVYILWSICHWIHGMILRYYNPVIIWIFLSSFISLLLGIWLRFWI